MQYIWMNPFSDRSFDFYYFKVWNSQNISMQKEAEEPVTVRLKRRDTRS